MWDRCTGITILLWISAFIRLDRPYDVLTILIAEPPPSPLIPTEVLLRAAIIMDGEAHPEQVLTIVEPIGRHVSVLYGLGMTLGAS